VLVQSLDQFDGDAYFCMIEIKNGRLVSSSLDGDMMLWRLDGNQGELTKIINCSSDSNILCLLLLSNGRVACGFAYGTIQIWNIEKDVMVHRLSDHTKPVNGLIELSNRNMASIAPDKATVKVWNVENGQLLNSF
jgi:WD40 repeat protein